MKKVMVIVAHPDDEALGAAGTLARHAKNGDTVHILFLADGEGARGSKDNLDERRRAGDDATEAMGAKDVVYLDFPDNQMDKVPFLEIVKAVEKHISAFSPDIIYTHHGGDLNNDHNITHRAVLTACRPMEGLTLEKIYAFEVLSSTEWASKDQDKSFIPDHYVDISEFYDAKEQAINAYSEEMRPFPHPRSLEAIEALATLRGSQSGLNKAEAFVTLKSFWR